MSDIHRPFERIGYLKRDFQGSDFQGNGGQRIMRGLLFRDFLNVRSYMKQMSILILVLVVFGISFNFIILFHVFVVFFGIMIVIHSIRIDENENWYRYAHTLPLGLNDLVKEKYILTMIINCAMALIALISSIVFSAIYKEDIVFLLKLTGLSAYCMQLVYFFELPFIFRFGLEKGRLVMWGLVMGINLLYLSASEEIGELIIKPGHDFLTYIFLLVIGVLLAILSYRCTVRLCRHKKW